MTTRTLFFWMVCVCVCATTGAIMGSAKAARLDLYKYYLVAADDLARADQDIDNGRKMRGEQVELLEERATDKAPLSEAQIVVCAVGVVDRHKQAKEVMSQGNHRILCCWHPGGSANQERPEQGYIITHDSLEEARAHIK